jgi:hypothetical protein
MTKNIICPCQTGKDVDRDSLLEEFADLRQKCAALKEVFVPDNVWQNFQKMSKEAPDSVGHKYKILGAFQLGILSKMTLPVHRYCLDAKRPLQDTYQKELEEHWLEEETILERHKKARGHEGKINELLCAAWLEGQGWKIDNLEALGGEIDIEATSTENQQWAIEVKYIGQEDGKFEAFEKGCISKDAVAGTFSIYDGYNFLLLKAYDASYQLSQKCTKKNKLAIIVFSHQTWGFNEMPIRSCSIDTRPLHFTDSASTNWNKFLIGKKKYGKYCNVEATLDEYITKLDELWVMQQHGDLTYSLEEIYNL